MKIFLCLLFLMTSICSFGIDSVDHTGISQNSINKTRIGKKRSQHGGSRRNMRYKKHISNDNSKFSDESNQKDVKRSDKINKQFSKFQSSEEKKMPKMPRRDNKRQGDYNS